MTFYLMHRGWQDNPVFGGEAFSRRDAWVWLIEHAAFRPTKIGLAGKTVELQRGQLAYAYRYLAEAWGWSVAGVQRYLGRLKTDTMIDINSDTGRMVITLCNYEAYQFATEEVDTPHDTRSGTEPIRERYAGDTNKKEVKRSRKKDSHVSVPAEQAFSMWNQLAGELGLSVAMKLDSRRRARLLQRLEECGGLDGWTAALAKVRASPFCRGDGGRGWRIDLDGLLQAKTFTKLIEGAYDDRLPADAGEVLSAVDRELSQWKGRLAMHAKDGTWLGSWGPEPGKPGCFVPRELILQPQPAGGI